MGNMIFQSFVNEVHSRRTRTPVKFINNRDGKQRRLTQTKVKPTITMYIC